MNTKKKNENIFFIGYFDILYEFHNLCIYY